MDAPARARRTSVVSIAVLGALLLALAESLVVLVLSHAVFSDLASRLAFVAVELGLVALLGAVVAVGAAVVRRADRAYWPALAMMAMLPLSIYAAWLAFLGPRAQQLPGRLALQAMVVVVCLAASWVGGQLFARVASPDPVAARGIAGFGLVGIVAVVCVVDQVVLPRLYPFFHRGLEILALALALLTVALWRPSRRAFGVIGLIVGIGLGALALGLRPATFTLVLERAPAASVIARPLLRWRARLLPEPISLPSPVVRRPLPPGPVLGPRDVIMITVDALRADRLNADVMPEATALAARGVRFEHALTPVPHTSFAIASLLTGRHTYALSTSALEALEGQTLPALLREHGYHSAAFYPPAVFFIEHDRLAAFDRSHYGFAYVKYEYLDAARRTDQVIEYFEHEKPARSFVWVHFFEPHEPYDVHDGVTAGTPGAPPAVTGMPESIRRYEGEAREVDHQLARLIEYLRAHRPGALLVLCADHGEEFGEHGGRYHGTTLFDEQLRVPLFFSVVGETSGLAPKVVDGPVSLVDVAGSVLALLGVASDPSAGLAPFLGVDPIVPTEAQLAEIDQRKAVVQGHWKLICDLDVNACALYDLAEDPAERHDVSSSRPEEVVRLRATLEHFVRGTGGESLGAHELLQRLPTMDGPRRLEALRRLASLPPVSAASPLLEAATPEESALLDLVRARGGDATARERLAKLTPAPWITPTLEARIALAVARPDALVAALARASDEQDVVPLANALVLTKDARSLDALVAALEPVRSRAAVVEALGHLGDPHAIGPLIERLAHDPYVPVRAALVRTLSQLARGAPSAPAAQVRAAFVTLAETENEAPVLRALVRALGPGRFGALEIATKVPVPTQGRERWLVLSEQQRDELLLTNGSRLPVAEGVASLPASVTAASLPRGAPVEAVLERPVPR